MIGQTAVSARGGKRAGRAMDVGLASFVAAVLGLFILYGVGFAQPAFLHEAAHDTRHAFTFPCH